MQRRVLSREDVRQHLDRWAMSFAGQSGQFRVALRTASRKYLVLMLTVDCGSVVEADLHSTAEDGPVASIRGPVFEELLFENASIVEELNGITAVEGSPYSDAEVQQALGHDSAAVSSWYVTFVKAGGTEQRKLPASTADFLRSRAWVVLHLEDRSGIAHAESKNPGLTVPVTVFCTRIWEALIHEKLEEVWNLLAHAHHGCGSATLTYSSDRLPPPAALPSEHQRTARITDIQTNLYMQIDAALQTYPHTNALTPQEIAQSFFDLVEAWIAEKCAPIVAVMSQLQDFPERLLNELQRVDAQLRVMNPVIDLIFFRVDRKGAVAGFTRNISDAVGEGSKKNLLDKCREVIGNVIVRSVAAYRADPSSRGDAFDTEQLEMIRTRIFNAHELQNFVAKPVIRDAKEFFRRDAQTLLAELRSRTIDATHYMARVLERLSVERLISTALNYSFDSSLGCHFFGAYIASEVLAPDPPLLMAWNDENSGIRPVYERLLASDEPELDSEVEILATHMFASQLPVRSCASSKEDIAPTGCMERYFRALVEASSRDLFVEVFRRHEVSLTGVLVADDATRIRHIDGFVEDLVHALMRVERVENAVLKSAGMARFKSYRGTSNFARADAVEAFAAFRAAASKGIAEAFHVCSRRLNPACASTATPPPATSDGTELEVAFATYLERIVCEQLKLKVEQCDERIRSVVHLATYCNELEHFKEELRVRYAARLLDRRGNSDLELALLNDLKSRLGRAFISAMITMKQDVENVSVVPGAQPIAAEVLVAESPPMVSSTWHAEVPQVSVAVLSRAHWPTALLRPVGIAMPSSLVHLLEMQFLPSYRAQHPKRGLEWIWARSTAEATVSSLSAACGFTKQVVGSAVHVAILMAVSRTATTTLDSLTSILSATGVPQPEVTQIVARSVFELIRCKILVSSSTTAEPPTTSQPLRLKRDDTVAFHPKLHAVPARVIKVQSSASSATRREVPVQQMDAARAIAVQCCVIRVMKSRREMEWASLVEETMGQLQGRFSCDAASVKKVILQLIDKDYLMRARDHPSLIQYIA